MQTSERQAFGRMLTDLHAYYGKDSSRFVLDVWWSTFENFSLEQVQSAINVHVKDPDAGRFMPKVADLVRVLSGTFTDRALIAWGKVYEAIGRVGAYRSVVFDDPAIHAVVEDLGGWVKLCRMPISEMGYVQHRFCETHRAYVGRGTFPYPCVLGGDVDPAGYLMRGLQPPKPVLVGNPAQARRVLEQGSADGRLQLTLADQVGARLGLAA